MKRIVLSTLIALFTLAGGLPGKALAIQQDLSNTPMFLGGGQLANLVLTFDNSYSMNAGFFPESKDDTSYTLWSTITPQVTTTRYLCTWQHPLFYYAGNNSLAYDPNVTYLPPFQSDGTRLPNSSFTAAWYDGYRANSKDIPAPFKVSPITNTVNLSTGYYPPTLERAALAHKDNPDTYASCNTNGVSGTVYMKLPYPTAGEGGPSKAFYYRPAATQVVPTSSIFGAWTAENAYLYEGNWEAVDVTTLSEDQKQNFANWYSYYSRRMLTAKAALSEVFAKASGFRFTYQALNTDTNDSRGTRVLNAYVGRYDHVDSNTEIREFGGTYKNKFFAWLHSITRSGDTPSRTALISVGEFYSRGSSYSGYKNPYWEYNADGTTGKEITCRANHHLFITDGYWNDPKTYSALPNEGAMSWAGKHLVTEAATLPDGKSYSVGTPGMGGSPVETRIFWNRARITPNSSGRCHNESTSPQNAPCTPSLADIAFHYWATDLRSDLTNNVPQQLYDYTSGYFTSSSPGSFSTSTALLGSDEGYWNPANDPANWQHVNTHIVGLGLNFSNAMSSANSIPLIDTYNHLRGKQGVDSWDWLKTTAGDTLAMGVSKQSGVNDAYHASIVGRGIYGMANNSAQLAENIQTLLSRIVQVQSGSNTQGTVSSTIAAGDDITAFKTKYDSADWSGDLTAHTAGLSGINNAVIWSGAAKLAEKDPLAVSGGRQILTSSASSGGGIPFRWSGLSSGWQTALNKNPSTGVADSLGEQRLEYLRGSHAQEISNSGPFRTRPVNKIMGAIINSGAALVGAPSASYQDDAWPAGSPEKAAADADNGYNEFRENNKNRTRAVYVGTSDGMLHAFDATPTAGNSAGTGTALFSYVPFAGAKNIAKVTSNQFWPGVDNSPVVRDVFIDGEWRTLLVGSMRKGGQGIFALDVTDPSQVTEANAASKVLWEFSDQQNANLGYTYGRPNISRLANGKWVVIVPGGYNNEEADDNAGDGTASLFVLDAEDGAVLKEINMSDASGLSFVTMQDDNGDGIDDAGYAGTLEGYLYRFDFTNTAPASWSARKFFAPAAADLGQRPITGGVRVFPDPATGKTIVVFGTGKFLEQTDRAVTGYPQQYLYGLRDTGPSGDVIADTTGLSGDLVAKTFTKVPASGGGQTYFTVSNEEVPESKKGYRIALEEGERIISKADAQFSLGIALIGSLIPKSNGDPCVGGLTGNFYILNAATGSAPNLGRMIDTNGNGTVNALDNANAIGVNIAEIVSEGTPPVLTVAGGGDAVLLGFSGVKLPVPVWRRRMWKELP